MNIGYDCVMIKPNEIAAVVVLYHPDDSVIANLNSYINQVEVIYAIDNTENDHVNAQFLTELKKNKKIIYRPNNENLGIATALNIGARNAIQSGCKFLLTMDQDSHASETMVDDLINCEAALNLSCLGILSPFHYTKITRFFSPSAKVDYVLTVWTSGSLVNLEAYKRVGPFNEDLFIDFVDHEYCLRLNLAGFKVFKVYNAILHHEIGTNITRNKFLGLPFFIASNHSALRRYYITRNRFYLAAQMGGNFPLFFLADKRKFVGELLTILLFEEDKFNKFKMILRGYSDYRKKKLGKFQPDDSEKQEMTNA